MNAEQHTIIVEAEGGCWMHCVSPMTFSSRSRGLYNLIQADIQRGRRETHIHPPSDLPSGTLERLILWIDQQRVPDRQNLAFNELLGLSIAIWRYDCDPVIFRRLAAAGPDQLMPGADAAGWTFMALVFNWEHDFRDASKMLICDFNPPLGVIEGAHYFPDFLRNAVVTARRRLLKTTFAFVRNDVMRYARHSPTFSHINHRLYAQGIDIALPENEYVRYCTRDSNPPVSNRECSPEKILDKLDDILRVPPQEGQPIESQPTGVQPPGVQPTQPVQQVGAQPNAAGSSSSGSAHGTGSTNDYQHIATLRSAGVNEGSIRRLVYCYISKTWRQRDERRRVPVWSRDDVGHFQVAAGEIRGRMVSRRIELFDGCGLRLADFETARRAQLILPEAVSGV